jgi:hypothetical protein
MAARRAAQQRKNLQGLAINTHMQTDAITTTAIATSQSVQNNRVETTRRQYVDNGGRVEVKETYYYYMIYDNKGKIAESTPNTVDLRV